MKHSAARRHEPIHAALRATLPLASALAVFMSAPRTIAAAPPRDPSRAEDVAPDPELDPRGAALARAAALGGEVARDPVAATPDDARWFDGFALPVVDGRISAFAEYGGELVMGGSFRQVGGERVNRIARWDGVAWRSLGDGLDGAVRTLEVIGDRLYAGGIFDVVGAVPAPGIAFWDGAQWNALGTGLSGTVNAITAYQGGVAVAGDLVLGAAAAEPRSGAKEIDVAHWDGAGWSALLSGLDGPVYDLAVFQDRLVAAGDFSQQSGVPLEHLAVLDDGSWSSLGGGVGGVEINPLFVNVLSLAVHEQRLWATGIFDRAGGGPADNVASWNGSEWVDAGALWGFPRQLVVVGGSLYASGALWADAIEPGLVAGVRRWNGVDWERPARNARDPVYVLGAFRDTLVVSGVGDLPVEDVLALRPGGWSPLRARWRDRDRGFVGRSRVATVRALLATGPDLFAGGEFAAAGSATGLIDAPSFAHTARDVLQWHVEPLATDFAGRVNAFAEFDGTVIAGGLFSAAPATPAERVSNIARWDGAGWSPLGAGLNGEVFALAVFRGELVAGGNFTQAGGAPASGLARWDGAQWRPLGKATTGSVVTYALLAEADTLWIGGAFVRLGGVVATNIARWDASTARFAGLGFGVRTASLDGYAGAIARHEGRLIVAGEFSRAGTIEVDQIAAWNGADWEPFGGQRLSGNLLTLRVANGTLWGGGTFQEEGGPPLHLGRWSGSAWEPAGSGPDGIVYAITPVGNALYVGGAFTQAGGKSAFGIARWDAGSPLTFGLATGRVDGAPNPMAGLATLAFTLPSAGRFELVIHDLGGRPVFATRETAAAAGERRVTWNGRGTDGGLVPAGVYFVSVASGGATRARGRIAVIR